MQPQSGAGAIVVGVDASLGAAEALRWAVAEGEIHGAAVTALMAWDLLDQHPSASGSPFDLSYGQADALVDLQRYIARAVGTDRALLVRARVVCDLPARALLDAAVHTDLLVVGARGLGSYRGALLGSVSQYCLHHARTPIAIIRDVHARERFGNERIVVGVDGSDTAKLALRWALREARLRKAAVDVVNVWQPSAIDDHPSDGKGFDPILHEASSQRVLDDALAGEDITELVEPVILRSMRGRPAPTICQVAGDADLLVMGSRGHGAARRLLLGSVATQVSHHAPCPLVVVPASSVTVGPNCHR
jgi:nucleotide-binding universal stress UspA family protein